MRTRNFVYSVIALALFVGPAAAAQFEIDSAHTSAEFSVRHLMISSVRGALGKVTGTVTLDESDISKSSVEASIDVKGLNTGDAKRDDHLRNPDFFDVAKYPTITFKSKKVTQAAADRFTVVGDLTMHGVTKEVSLDVEGSSKPINDPWGNVKLGGQARTKVNRQDFGMSFSATLDNGGLVVGNDVDVTINVELTQKK